MLWYEMSVWRDLTLGSISCGRSMAFSDCLHISTLMIPVGHKSVVTREKLIPIGVSVHRVEGLCDTRHYLIPPPP